MTTVSILQSRDPEPHWYLVKEKFKHRQSGTRAQGHLGTCLETESSGKCTGPGCSLWLSLPSRPRLYLHSHLGGHSDNEGKLATTGKGGSLHWAHQTHRLTEVFSRLGTPPKTSISSPTIVPEERKMRVAFPIHSVKHNRKP